MLLRANVLARGHSGIRARDGRALLALLNAGVHPVVPSRGSVGASGDLAPLAHLALVLIGEGEAVSGHGRVPGAEALATRRTGTGRAGAERGPGAHQRHAGVDGRAGAGAGGRRAARPGRRHRRRRCRSTRCGGRRGRSTRESTPPGRTPGRPSRPPTCCGCWPEAPSMRRMPTAGACRTPTPSAARRRCTAPAATRSAFTAQDGRSRGQRVDRQPDGLCRAGRDRLGRQLPWRADRPSRADLPAIAVTHFATISERRAERLVNPALSDLPAFLTEHGGLESGLMLAQVTAAALASELKSLAHPVSVDTIPDLGEQGRPREHEHGAPRSRPPTPWRSRRWSSRSSCSARARAIDLLAPLTTSTPLARVHAAVRDVAPRACRRPSAVARHRSDCRNDRRRRARSHRRPAVN